ncbi:MAG: hypothetical protein RIT26_2531 [Pseudomonadota bacterium]
MNMQDWRAQAWLLPWVGMIAVYAAMGWLDPAHWLGSGLPAPAASPVARPAAPARGQAARAAVPPGPAPWPDEPALRRLLTWHGLTPMGLTLGPQRGRQSEVRLALRASGRMGDGLAMFESLAFDWPQMVPESLTLQADSPGLWRFEWRGTWRPLEAPHTLPARPKADPELKILGAARVLDGGWLLAQLRQQHAGGTRARQWLSWVHPEQLQLWAVAHDPAPQAWVGWQQHVLVLRVGDRIGPEQTRVSAIGREELRLSQPGREWRLRPQSTAGWPEWGAP